MLKKINVFLKKQQAKMEFHKKYNNKYTKINGVLEPVLLYVGAAFLISLTVGVSLTVIKMLPEVEFKTNNKEMIVNYVMPEINLKKNIVEENYIDNKLSYEEYTVRSINNRYSEKEIKEREGLIKDNINRELVERKEDKSYPILKKIIDNSNFYIIEKDGKYEEIITDKNGQISFYEIQYKDINNIENYYNDYLKNYNIKNEVYNSSDENIKTYLNKNYLITEVDEYDNYEKTSKTTSFNIKSTDNCSLNCEIKNYNKTLGNIKYYLEEIYNGTIWGMVGYETLKYQIKEGDNFTFTYNNNLVSSMNQYKSMLTAVDELLKTEVIKLKDEMDIQYKKLFTTILISFLIMIFLIKVLKITKRREKILRVSKFMKEKVNDDMVLLEYKPIEIKNKSINKSEKILSI
jgi:hypothetical protein